MFPPPEFQEQFLRKYMGHLMFGPDYRMSQSEMLAKFDAEFIKMRRPKNLFQYGFKNTTMDRKQKMTTLKLSQLKPTYIREFELGKVHEGKYIKVKFTRDCYIMAAVHGIVEDEKKNICAIAIYNFPYGDKTYDKVFKKDVEIFIKEPYFKNSKGYVNIRIDDPSDIQFEEEVKIMKGDDIVKSKQAQVHKEEGSKLFTEGNFVDALIEYSRAITYESEDEKLSILWSNKALCFINLRCGNDALSACQTALKFNANNQKALYRRISALILLDQFQKAEEEIESLEANLPAKDLASLKNRMKIKQNYKQGNFNWKSLFDSYDPQEYFSPKIAIKKSQAVNQLSIFAVKQIQPYEILLIQKAVCYITTPSQQNLLKTRLTIQVSDKTGKIQMDEFGTKAKLRTQAQKLFFHAKDARKKIKNLWDHNSMQSTLENRQSQQITADILREKIIQNSCHTRDLRTFITTGESNAVGLWQKVSLLNFYCNANVHAIALNDTMIVLSSKAIKKGEQLFINSTHLAQMKGAHHKNTCEKCAYCEQKITFQKVAKDLQQKIPTYTMPQILKIIHEFKTMHWKVELLLYQICVWRKQPSKQLEEMLVQEADITNLAVVCSGRVRYTGFAWIVARIVEKIFGEISVVKNILSQQIYESIVLEKEMMILAQKGLVIKKEQRDNR